MVERELLGVLLALENFERYIFAVPVTVIMDHNFVEMVVFS